MELVKNEKTPDQNIFIDTHARTREYNNIIAK